MWMDNWILNAPPSLWPKWTPQQHPCLFRFFETKKTVVVLSSSNKPQREVNEDICAQDGVPILRRKGGGGTVVLGEGCLVLTLAFYAKNLYANKEYFYAINQLWIDALTAAGVSGLSQNGISDICHGNQKVAGTSLFRKKHLLVYQGSLLVNPKMDLIEKYLAYPSQEPEYRQGRSHRDFLTSLSRLGWSGDAQSLADFCQDYFSLHVPAALGPHFYFEDSFFEQGALF